MGQMRHPLYSKTLAPFVPNSRTKKNGTDEASSRKSLFLKKIVLDKNRTYALFCRK